LILAAHAIRAAREFGVKANLQTADTPYVESDHGGSLIGLR